MAIKGIGFNDSDIRNQTIASGDTLEVDGDITAAEGVNVTAGGVAVTAGGISVTAGGASITGNSSITGNLTVTGTLISQDEQQTLVKDNFLDLNFGYVGTSYEQTGLTFNYQATSSGVSIDTTSNNINFTAGTTTDRAKVVADTTSGIPADTFAENDIIQISGTTNGDNDGIYVVHANGSAGTIEFKSSTLTSPDSVNAKFALLNVTTEEEATSTAVTIRKVNLMALRSSNAGVLQSATGAVDSSFATYTSVGAGSVTLQNAYDNGQTITVDGDNLAIDADGAGTRTFAIGATNNFATFSADAAAVTIEATGTAGADLALTFADDGSASAIIGYGSTAQLTVTTTQVQVSDDLILNQASGQQLISRATDAEGEDLKISVTGNQNSSLILESEGSSGTDALIIQTVTNSGGIDINSVGAVTIDASAASNFTTSSGALTLDGASGVSIAGNAAEIDITTTGALDINSAALTITPSTVAIDPSSTFDLDAAGALTIDAASITIGGDSDTGAIAVDSTSTISIDSADTTNLTMTANAGTEKVLTISASNSGAGEGNVDIDASERIDLQLGGTSIAQIVDTAGDTALVMGSGSAILADGTGGFQFGESGQTVTEIDTDGTFASAADTALATQLAIKTYVDSVAGAATIQLTASVDIDARDVVAIALTGGSAGQAIKADANSAGTCQVIGFAEAAATATNTVTIRTSGNLTGFSGLTAGNKLYASTTAGGVTATAPSGSGDVIFQVGYARSTTEIVIVPQYIMELG